MRAGRDARRYPVLPIIAFSYVILALSLHVSGVNMAFARFPLILVLGVYLWVPPAFAKKKASCPSHQPQTPPTPTDLQQVPGIGPSHRAKKSSTTRKSYGAFRSVDDLLAIKGIGPKKLEEKCASTSP